MSRIIFHWKNKPNFLAAGIFLAALGTSLGQSTVQFATGLTTTVAENAGVVNLWVQRIGDTNTVVSVDYATADGTATAGLRYTAANGTLTFADGETKQTITVPILSDGLPGPTVTFVVTLSNPTNTVLGAISTANVRVTNNNKGLQLELATYSVNEDAGATTIRVLRQDDGNYPASVDYATTNLTATAGQDYLDTSGTLTFAPGETLKKITVTLLNDAVREPSRTFKITLKNPSSGVALGTPITATVTITDTDNLVQLQSTSLTVREDAAFARVGVVRGESTLTTTVDLTTANITAVAGQDYTGLTNTLSFTPGERLKFIDVPLINNGLQETSKTFRIGLSNPAGGAVLGPTTTLTVTILNSGPGVGFDRSTSSVWEKMPGLTLNVVRGNAGWLGPFTADYQTVNGTALAGVDYQAASGTLSFATNEMVRSISVLFLSNPAPGSSKSFMVTLSNLTGQIPMGRSSSLVTIVNSSKGYSDSVQPPMRGGIAKDAGLIQVAWPGSATVSRADSIAGPWEQLGTIDNPLITAPNLPGAFYQLRSPRSAPVYVPSSYDGHTSMPLVVMLHGYSGNPPITNYFQMVPLAETRGFLVCYPGGTVDSSGNPFWNATDACCNFYGATVDDSAYLRGVIEEVARHYAVDRKRIYVTGLSNSGFMSHRMASDNADLIAGIAAMGGATFLDPSTHPPSQPVNVLQIHGTADTTVPYAGGVLGGLPLTALFPGAMATIQIWAGFNGCTGLLTDPQASLDLTLDAAGLDTTVTRYTNCPPGGAVELWTMNGVGHVPALTTNFAPRVIDWLLAHRKP